MYYWSYRWGKVYTVNITIGLAWSDSHCHNDILLIAITTTFVD